MAEAGAPAPSATLYATHKHIAARCAAASAAFLACKGRDANPEVCLKEGSAVTACVVSLCVHRARAVGLMLAVPLGGTWRPLERCWAACGLCTAQLPGMRLFLPRAGAPVGCWARDSADWRCSCRLKEVGAQAGPELDAYAACLDYNSNAFPLCRKQQAAFEGAAPL